MSPKIELEKPKRKHIDLKKAVISLLAKRHKKVSKIEKKAKKIKKKKEKAIASGGELTKFKSDLDLLKAEVMALKELTKGNTETITMVSEHVGEFKIYIIDLEKNINRLLVQVNKNSMRLDDINPVGARKNIAKQNAKIEEFEERLLGLNDMQKQMMEQIKQLRGSVGKLKDVQSLMELNEELNEKIIELQKLVTLVEKYAGKTEGIYVEMQSSIKDAEMFKKQIETLQSSHEDMIKGMEEIRQKVKEQRNARQKRDEEAREDVEKPAEKDIQEKPIKEQKEEIKPEQNIKQD
jgi:DNA repair exonuclease SbcCD ATPase subunit